VTKGHRLSLASPTSLRLTSRATVSVMRARAVATITNLISLKLGGNQIGDVGAFAIARLANLSSLDLEANHIGPEGARAIADLTGLTSLELGGNRIGDEGALAIAGLTKLISLDLWNSNIGDKGARALATLTNLTSLTLWNNSIDDDGADAIGELSKLVNLDLEGNTIGGNGARSLLNIWADSETALNKTVLNLSRNDIFGDELPSDLFDTNDAQKILTAYRLFRDDEDSDPPEDVSADLTRALRFGDDGGRIGGAGGGAADEAVADTAITREFRGRAAMMAERMLAIAADEAGRGNAFHDLREKADELLRALGQDPGSINPALLSALVGEFGNALTADDARLADPEMEDRPPLSTELREALANVLESAERLVTHDDLPASLTKDLREDEISAAQGQAITAMGDSALEAGAATETARRELKIVGDAAPRSGVHWRSAGNFVRSGIRIAWEAMKVPGRKARHVWEARITTARWIVANREAVIAFVNAPRKVTTEKVLDRLSKWLVDHDAGKGGGSRG
jgi:hypothetical protein